MKIIQLKLSEELHDKLIEIAKEMGIGLNQLINNILEKEVKTHSSQSS